MGQAILYCFRCSTQLREAQFEQRKAFRVDAWVCCAACVPEALKSLPPGRAEALQKQISGPTEKRPAPKRDSNSRTPLAPEPAPAPAAGGAIKLVLIAVAAVGVVIIAAMAFSGKPEPETLVRPPDRTAPPPPRVQPPTTTVKPPSQIPAPPPPPTTDSPQKQALLMARQYAREYPDDLEGQLRLFGDLTLLEDKTEVGAEARKTVDVLQVKQRHAVEQGLAALGPELADPLVREDYGKALRVLLAAQSRIPGAQWKLALEKREREIREKIFVSFEIVKAKALDARAKGNRSEVDAVRALVRSWGLEKMSSDLDQALAAAGEAAPPPPASADAQAYSTLKEQAFVRAARDFAAAAVDLERAGAGLKEDAVRKEIADDVRNLKELDRIYQATIAGLASSKSLTLRTVENQSVSGRVLSADADRVELFVEPQRPTVFVEWSDVRASTLSPFLKSQNAEAPLLALFEQADAVARPKPSAEELRARELYYEAERQFREMATREKAIEAYKQLKLKLKDTALVRRAMARIERRSESGKEYYFLPPDLALSGTFAPTKDGRVETLTGSEPAQMARNWVEWEFYPLPTATYRCWVLAGGCCAESFTVHLQATGLTEMHPKTKKRSPAEPGSDLWAPLKHSIRNLKPTHPKGEPVKPTRWEWIEIPLPKPPGVRRARLLTDQQGFGVAAVVVSSTRTRAPTEAEAAELAKARALDAPPAWALHKGGNAARVLLDDFEQGITGWGFHPGTEFPGAKGEQTHDAAVGRDGKGALKIAADFTSGGSYVSSAKTIPAGSDFKEVRLWLKSDNAVHIGIRVGDGTDQCHQMPIMIKATKEWQEVVLTFEKLAGRESWGGAADRKWHGPAKWFAICVSKTTFSGKPAGEVWIDDVEGVLNVPE